jgi:hypothetical protein
MFKKWFCKHDYELVMNFYGDTIIHMAFKRSMWKCDKCGKVKFSDYLNKLN